MKLEILKQLQQSSISLCGGYLSCSSVGVRRVLIMMQKGINPTPQPLLRLLSPQRSDIKEVISCYEGLSTSSISRVSMEDLPILGIEDAITRLLAIKTVSNTILHHRLLIIVVVLNRSDGLIHCDMEIVVEILAERRAKEELGVSITSLR